MITETRDIFESLEELIEKKDAAAVGDIVLVAEESGKVPYVVAQTEGNLFVVRKNIMADYRPMKTKNFDLNTWLNGDFRTGILVSLPENLRERIGVVKLPSIKEVYGRDYFGIKSEGEQFEWFKDPINRIAIKEDCEYSDYWWLRDVVSATYFAVVASGGYCHINGASRANIGVRPAFIISRS
jgi:hypothetical protein